jgi:phosphoglycolate phosphatase
MTAPLRLFIFDCDGTLADSQHLIAESMRRAFMDEGVIPPSRTDILRTVGLSIPQAVTSLVQDPCDETVTAISDGYRKWCTVLRGQPGMQEPMFKGAAPFLAALAKEEGVCLGIATGKSRRGLNRFVEANGLASMFATLQSADDAPSKPHPAMIEQAMADTGAEPENTVMIGDTTFDIIMARRAGVRGIGVSWGHHRMDELKAAGADAVAVSFGDLNRLLMPQQFEAGQAA